MKLTEQITIPLHALNPFKIDCQRSNIEHEVLRINRHTIKIKIQSNSAYDLIRVGAVYSDCDGSDGKELDLLKQFLN